MPIKVSCACGRSMLVKDELAGRKIYCPDCRAVLTVPAAEPAAKRAGTTAVSPGKQKAPPPPAADDDDVPLIPLGQSDPPLREAVQAKPPPRRPAAEDTDDLEVVGAADEDDEDDPDDLEARRRERRRREKERAAKDRDRRDERRRERRKEAIERAEDRGRERRRAGVVFGDSWTNAGVIGGVVMLLIAIIWFVGGLAVGIIFIYPPILAVLGIAAIIRGIFSGR